MTDLEMVRLCAEAMGYTADEPIHDGAIWIIDGNVSRVFHPLHDDADAMSLMKRWGLSAVSRWKGGPWIVASELVGTKIENADLNRAIVECVAKMQREKN